MMKTRVLIPFVPLLTALACAGNSKPPSSTPANVGAPPQQGRQAPATFAEQAAAGKSLYAEHCARCHGDSGQGSQDAPRLVGLQEGALPLDPPPGAKYRKSQFETVADVANFVTKNMPPDAPGSLSEDQYWDILAFDLKANGIDLGDKKLDAALAKTLVIPR